MATYFPEASDPRELMSVRMGKTEAAAFHCLVSEGTYHFCQTLQVTQANPGTMCIGELHEGVTTRQQGPLRTIVKAGSYRAPLSLVSTTSSPEKAGYARGQGALTTL